MLEGVKSANHLVKVAADGFEFALQIKHAGLEIVQGMVVVVQDFGLA